jgi:hypothetical protein
MKKIIKLIIFSQKLIIRIISILKWHKLFGFVADAKKKMLIENENVEKKKKIN